MLTELDFSFSAVSLAFPLRTANKTEILCFSGMSADYICSSIGANLYLNGSSSSPVGRSDMWKIEDMVLID